MVPANPDDWTHDPFGGELIDGEVWGRGAIDMLNLTDHHGHRHTPPGPRADSGPKGDLTYIAVADEEALSTYGARWLCANAADDIRTDYVITESGGFPMDGADGVPRLPVIVGEKGVFWCILTVRGTPGHASQPLRTDNALVKAAEVVRRIDEYRPQAELHEAWTRFIDGLGLPPDLSEPLLDPDRIDEFCEELPLLGLARQAHACTHTTMAPTVMRAGHQDERDPRPGGARGRHPGAAGVADRGRAGHARRRTRRPGRRRRDRLPVRGAGVHLPHRHPACGTPSSG